MVTRSVTRERLSPWERGDRPTTAARPLSTARLVIGLEISEIEMWPGHCPWVRNIESSAENLYGQRGTRLRV
ncbi:hypothetical protein chiPu_0002668 [Chiloscyllium punctatum]|uniref:Uncharacterized protein n=1 Tax=Chiloscyllium punctatum TaxID=137246 RepID=A0A401S1L8_CHIPU|nr:hypothetical protein [Chiloscyllium punctatum]